MHTIETSALQRVTRLAGEHGIDPDRLREALGLPPDGAAAQRLPIEVVDAAWVLAARMGPPDIGQRVAARVTRSSFGLLTHALAASATVGDALRRLERGYAVLSGGTHYRLQRRGAQLDIHVRFEGRRPAVVESFAAGVVVGFLRNASDWRPTRVELRQAPGVEHANLMGPDVRYGATRTRIVTDASAAALPMHDADPSLADVLDDQVRMRLARLEPQPRAWASRVRACLAREEASAPRVAAMLGVHERTLRRHLRREDVAFSDLLEAHRRARAADLLRTTDAPLSELAQRLGYAESASFSRAFRRWYGLSPRAFSRAAATARRP